MLSCLVPLLAKDVEMISSSRCSEVAALNTGVVSKSSTTTHPNDHVSAVHVYVEPCSYFSEGEIKLLLYLAAPFIFVCMYANIIDST
jgi:hypothetical protein